MHAFRITPICILHQKWLTYEIFLWQQSPSAAFWFLLVFNRGPKPGHLARWTILGLTTNTKPSQLTVIPKVPTSELPPLSWPVRFDRTHWPSSQTIFFESIKPFLNFKPPQQRPTLRSPHQYFTNMKSLNLTLPGDLPPAAPDSPFPSPIFHKYFTNM